MSKKSLKDRDFRNSSASRVLFVFVPKRVPIVATLVHILAPPREFDSTSLAPGAVRAVVGGRLAQQSHESNKQRANEHYGPVPDIQIEKPAVGRHEFEVHRRPRRRPTRRRWLFYYRPGETIDNCQN
jgi:hypothetical protein